MVFLPQVRNQSKLENKRSAQIEGHHQVAQWYRICLPVLEMQVPSLGGKDPLEEGMATHSSVLAWKFPWTGALGGLQSYG